MPWSIIFKTLQYLIAGHELCVVSTVASEGSNQLNEKFVAVFNHILADQISGRNKVDHGTTMSMKLVMCRCSIGDSNQEKNGLK